MMSTSTCQPRDITAEEFAIYHRDGAVLLKQFLPESLLEQIASGLESAYHHPGTMASRLVDDTLKGEIRMDQMPSYSNEALAEVVRHPLLVAVASQLLGHGHVHHILDQMFYKPAGTLLPTAWHQDTPYLSVKGDELCRLWISCDPSPAEATISVIRGSHRWNIEYRPVEPDDVSAKEDNIGGEFTYDQDTFDTSLPKVPNIAEYPESFEILSWAVEPGDVLAFNGNILHGNNDTLRDYPRPRRAFAALYGAPTVKTLLRPGNRVPDIAMVRNIGLKSGIPLAQCAAAYPVYPNDNHSNATS